MFKKLLSTKKAVAFDLDGTITNSKPFWKAALTTVGEKYGIFGADVTPLMHLAVEGIWQELLKTYKPEPAKTITELTEETYTVFLDLCQKAELEYMEGLPETMGVLKVGRNFKTILATNTIKKVAEKMLDMMDVKFYFNDFVYRDDVKNIKPNPEMYKLCAKKLSVRPSELLVFEDSPVGVEAAVKAGCDVVVIWNGLTPQDDYPNDTKIKAFIEDFSDFWSRANIDTEEEVQRSLEETTQKAKQLLTVTRIQPHQ